MKTLIKAILIWLFAQGASAQRLMSLDDCLVYAKEHALSNRMEELNAQSMKTYHRESIMAFLPSVSGSISGGMSFGRGVDQETNVISSEKSLSNGYNLSVSLPVFDGLVNVNTVRAQKIAHLQAKTKAEIQKDQTSLSVVRQYYNMCYYQALATQAELQLAADREQLRRASLQEEIGQKSGADVDELKATVASSEFSLIQQQNLAEQASVELKFAMNYPLDSVIVVEAPMSSRPLMDDSAEGFSVDGNLNVEQARLEMEYSRYALKMARGQFSPQLVVSGELNTGYFKKFSDKQTVSYSEQMSANFGQNVSAYLSIPIFNRMSSQYNVKRKKIAYQKSQMAFEETRRTIEKEMRMAWMELNAAYKEYLSAEASLSAQNISHRANVRKFEMGSISALELQTSSNKRANAEAVSVGKLIQLYIKQIEWNYYNNKKIW